MQEVDKTRENEFKRKLGLLMKEYDVEICIGEDILFWSSRPYVEFYSYLYDSETHKDKTIRIKVDTYMDANDFLRE